MNTRDIPSCVCVLNPTNAVVKQCQPLQTLPSQSPRGDPFLQCFFIHCGSSFLLPVLALTHISLDVNGSWPGTAPPAECQLTQKKYERHK